MIWLAWRQLRAPARVTLGLLAVLAVGLGWFGLTLRDAYDSGVAGCAPERCTAALNDFRRSYEPAVALLGVFVMAVPALIGAFWGAPLVARELEAGTHRLAWTQGVSRTRWLTVKLAVVALLGVAVSGTAGLLLTWAAAPWDDEFGTRFVALTFASRNLTPFGYAAFAVVLGVAVGMLLRRTLAAMAVTLAVVAVLQLVVPFAVRSHYLPPVEERVAVAAGTLSNAGGFGITGSGPPPGATGVYSDDARLVVDEYQVPGAWLLTGRATVMDADGSPADPALGDECFRPGEGLDATGACLATRNLYFDIAYQPGDRYWPFQLIEAGGYLLLALLLAGFAVRLVPRVAA